VYSNQQATRERVPGCGRQTEMTRITGLRNAIAYLFPHEAERDGVFRLEVQRLGRRSLFALSILTGVLHLFYVVLVETGSIPVARSELPSAVLPALLVCLAALVLARSRWGLSAGRPASLVLMALATASAFRFDLKAAANITEAERFVLADFTGALLFAVVLIPALPVQTLTLGLSLTAVAAFQLSNAPFAPAGLSPLSLTAVLIMDSVLCAILSAVSYNRLWSAHRSSQEVCQTQRLLLVSDNASSMAKLSAALSHELNNPLGILKSSLSTLKDLRGRLAAAEPAVRKGLERTVGQLETNADRALGRMEEIVREMQRFTNLDRAEEREFQVNRVVKDVVSLLDPEAVGGIRIELDLHQVPRVVSKPHLLSAIIARLLQESVSLVSPDGWIRVATRAEEPAVKVLLQDSRPPIPGADLAKIFEPCFHVSGGRVTAGNWTWFNARQILREHGAEISVTSTAESTTAIITLPL